MDVVRSCRCCRLMFPVRNVSRLLQWQFEVLVGWYTLSLALQRALAVLFETMLRGVVVS